MKTYKIHILRHGLTQANLDGLYCGSTDLPLCAEGVTDLMRLSDEYTYPYIDVMYTSPMLRARQSANILFPGCDHEVLDGLREASFGVYEGKKFSEIKDIPEFQKWVAFGSEYTPDGAEPYDVFQLRCAETFIKLVDNMMRNGITSAAIMTHSGVLANVLSALAYPKKTVYDWQCIPGCGYTLLADPTLFMRQPAVEVISYVPKDLDF